jgi:hypothetical protein
MEIHHFGSGICNQIRCKTGNIFMTTRPATIIKSHCRGVNRMTSLPKRDKSCRLPAELMSSIPQHAVAKGIGHKLLALAHEAAASKVVRKTLSPTVLFISVANRILL